MIAGNMHKNLVKITRAVWKMCSQTDRQTHTHRRAVLITILRHRSRSEINDYCKTAAAHHIPMWICVRLY